MSPPADDSPAGSTGPPDRQTLRLLERQLAGNALTGDTNFKPDVYEPRLLRGMFDTEQYLADVTVARLDIRWFTTGDFSFHYVETRGENETWECRWDRHPNPHNIRLHFHEPPTGAAITNLDLSSVHPLEVYATVVTAIEQRIKALW